jgi:hypothetical protein
MALLFLSRRRFSLPPLSGARPSCRLLGPDGDPPVGSMKTNVVAKQWWRRRRRTARNCCRRRMRNVPTVGQTPRPFWFRRAESDRDCYLAHVTYMPLAIALATQSLNKSLLARIVRGGLGGGRGLVGLCHDKAPRSAQPTARHGSSARAATRRLSRETLRRVGVQLRRRGCC